MGVVLEFVRELKRWLKLDKKSGILGEDLRVLCACVV
jgi:hypothetical protein